MKLTIDKTTFADAVTFVARTIPARPANPVLAGVVLHATDGRLALSAFDHETSATTTVTADVATEGRAIVSGRLLAEIAKSLPNKPVTLETDGALIHVRCGSSKFRLLTMPSTSSPPYPRPPQCSAPSQGTPSSTPSPRSPSPFPATRP